MKTAGFIVVFIGLILAVLVLSMDTSVYTDTGVRVNNLGLMSEKQNYLILTGVIIIAGVILFVKGKDKPKESIQSDVKNLN